MKKNPFPFLTAGFVLLVLACGLGSDPATPNTQATVDAAVAATNQAQAAGQATIDAAVQATDTAQAAIQATVEAATRATGTAQAISLTPTANEPPAPVEATTPAVASDSYLTMTEEELATVVDQAVTEAVQATEQYATAAAEATTDSTVTAEEVQTVELYLSGAEEAIALAEELLYVYDDLYGALATETVLALEELNQSLDEIAQYAAMTSATLSEINSNLEQGLTLAEETITDLETVATLAATKAGSMPAEIQDWHTTQQTQLEHRVSTALSTPPTEVATGPQEAVQSMLEFMNAGQQAVEDQKLSLAELETLAQLGANAQASLAAQDQPQLQQLAGPIAGITEQFARGNIGQAQRSLGQLDHSVKSIPELEIPSRPEIERPGGPDVEKPAIPEIDPPARPSRG